MRSSMLLALTLATLALAACAPAGPATDRLGREPGPVGKKTLVALMNDEPKKLGPIGPGGGSLQSSSTTPYLYESFLIVNNDQGLSALRLSTDIPTVDNGGWRLLPDGSMETTWHLRRDAFWHDGAPFTARDLAFTWEVWNDPLVEVGRNTLNLYIHRVEMPDAYTVVYHWQRPFAFVQQTGRHAIVPEHLLAEPLRGDRELFNNHRYNTTEYVGLGPYRLKNWAPGSHFEFEAFNRYFLGRPKIDTIIARFVTDPNVLATNLLAGHGDMNIPWGATTDVVFPVEEQWKRTNEGKVWIYPGPSLRFVTHQNRDEYVKPRALKELPVRQALMHGLDKEALVELLYRDRNLLADSWYALGDPRRQQFADVITSYAYDPRRAIQLLEERDWRPGPDGILVHPTGERFETSLSATAESGEAVAAIAAYWRQIGIAVREDILSPAHTQDRELRAKFPGMEYSAHVPIRSFLNGRFRLDQIPAPENRWSGTNRSGLADPLLHQLMLDFDATLDDSQRVRVEREMARQSTANVSFGFLFFYPHQWMVRNHVVGAVPSKVASTVDDWPRVTWNVHEWDIRR